MCNRYCGYFYRSYCKFSNLPPFWRTIWRRSTNTTTPLNSSVLIEHKEVTATVRRSTYTGGYTSTLGRDDFKIYIGTGELRFRVCEPQYHMSLVATAVKS
ncbi:hypothetical protein TNIN_253481 [Trichonephila inaurata madagascariensis]|uniref:Uncharacterized protein n=1 Tax=Trichonephila inaurata madagascariensis TaxID=2747483 RepID=A0A8X7CKB3_9ARAC|nr:hypothetical protein TNIN_253481 [Trichonephila inaurata madagascariensis]